MSFIFTMLPHASTVHATASVLLSICQIPVLYQNGCMDYHAINATSFSCQGFDEDSTASLPNACGVENV